MAWRDHLNKLLEENGEKDYDLFRIELNGNEFTATSDNFIYTNKPDSQPVTKR